MRAETVEEHSAFSTARCLARPSGLFWCGLLIFLPLLFPPAAGATPGLHPESQYGPYARRFKPPGTAGLNAAAPALLSVQSPTARLERKITVDSTEVEYRRFSGGFPEGPAISMNRDEYLGLEYVHQRRRLWHQHLRQQFRSSAVRQLRQEKRRFQWSVPFPESRTLRRIIGEEGPTLSLNGSRTITISGKSEWTEGEVQTAAGRPSKFPSLSMDQESKFTVEGRVGELINIRINQDTESFGSAFSSGLSDQLANQLANQIKLDYKGDEDAIFQEVQAGNTTLELPTTRFVGFRQQNKGLFGIRAKGHLGPMAFTTIASHEKSKSNRRTFKGGAAVDTTVIRDWQYVRSTYFFLDEVYRDRLMDFRKLDQGVPEDIRNAPDDFVDPSTLEVYVNDFTTNNDAEQLAKEGVAWAAFDQPREESGWVERGSWHRLDPDDDYTLVGELGYLILRRPVQERHALAVIYRTVDGRRFGSKDGNLLQLKLVKARDARPEFPTWNLEWKNVYRIATGFSPGRKFDLNSLDVQILKEIPGQEPEPSQDGVSYLRIFGLDRRGKDPNSPPDRIIDKDYVGLDDIRGHLIFPDQTPFHPRHPDYQALQDTIPEIYISQQQRDLVEASRYLIQVRSSSTEQRISLGGVLGGVRSETVEVRLNGRPLERGTHYNVDFVGNVTFIGTVAQEVGDPGTDLEITYETEDVFGLGSQQKTLLGLRTEYEFWGGDGRIGSTMIYNNERTSERRVRVGSEPSRAVIWNLDLRARRSAPFLTRLVDALPLLKTAAPSQLTLEAEMAQSRPNLNTRDKGYIDDFEGSERPISLSIGRTRWTPSSPPATDSFDERNQGRLRWYNPFDGVLRTDIWPGQEEQLDVQNKRTDVLALELTPAADQPESWGGVMSAFSAVNDFSQSKFLEVWARGEEGVLHIDLGTLSEDVDGDGRLDTEDKPFPGRSTGDGLVSKEEDVGIDGRDDREELVYYVALDSLLDAGVDLDRAVRLAQEALEMLTDDEVTRFAEERKDAFQASFGAPDPDVPAELRKVYRQRDPKDPEGDNWRYDPGRSKNDYSRINGTERNKVDLESGDLPDTEDLNNDGVLNTDKDNNYYHYTVDLSRHGYEVPGTRNDNGWRQFRVPLFGDETERAGVPDSTRVEYARLMLASDKPVKAEIALIEVVGNEWQEDEILDLLEGEDPGSEESFNVTVIGTDKNPNYHPPPGVKIRRHLQTRTREREQSLVLEYDRLESGHQMGATRILPRDANYTKYTRMRMHVHGDSAEVDYVQVPRDSSDLELFVRFGADSTNYYESITPVFPGWQGGLRGWKGNRVDVDLLEISQLKAILQTGRTDLTERPLAYVVLDPKNAPVAPLDRLAPDALLRLRDEGFAPEVALDMEVAHPHRRDGEPALYRVRGNPSMQQIKQLSIGLRNRGEQAYSGRVFVDELRLEEARNDPGVAAYARVNTQLADFMNLDSQVQWRGETFRNVTGGGGNSTDLSTSLQASAQLHQFLPGRWGFSIPVKMNFSRTENLPRFGPNSDVELTKKEKREQMGESSKEFYDLSLSRRQGKNWLLRWTIDQMNLRLSHSVNRQSNPTRPLDTQEAQTMSFGYRMPLPKPSLSPFSWLPGFTPSGFRGLEVRFLPSNLSYSMGANRRAQESWQHADADTTFQQDFRLNETYSAKLSPITGMSGDYSLRVNRDLRKKFAPSQLSFGREVDRAQTADVTFTLRFIKWLDQNYTFKANYEENSDPIKRRGLDPTDPDSFDKTGKVLQTRDITTKNDLSARLNLKVPTLLKSMGKSSRSSRKDGNQTRQEKGQQQGPQETETAKEEEQKIEKNGKPFFLWRVLHFTGDYVEPLRGTWRRNTNTRSFNLVTRPPLLYQLGLDDSLKVARAGVGLTQQDTWSRTSTLEMDSGMRFPLGISLKSNYSEKFERRSGSSQTRLRVRKEQRFPKLNLTWGRADRLPYIKKFINSAQVNVSFEEIRHREGEGTVEPRDLLTRGKDREFRASWNGRLRLGPTLNIEKVSIRGTSSDFEVLSDEDETAVPPLRGTSDQKKNATTFSIRHNLKPRSLPLFGRLKSNVDLKFEIGKEKETRANATGEAARAPITADDRWRTSLRASYNFSENFRGEGFIRVENNHNKLIDKTRKIREVKLAGTFFLR